MCFMMSPMYSRALDTMDERSDNTCSPLYTIPTACNHVKTEITIIMGIFGLLLWKEDVTVTVPAKMI